MLPVPSVAVTVVKPGEIAVSNPPAEVIEAIAELDDHVYGGVLPVAEN